MEDVIEEIYSKKIEQWDANLKDKVILATKNKKVHYLNEKIMQRIIGKERTYKSINAVYNDGVEEKEQVDIDYPQSFLQSLTLPGMPLN